MSTTHQRSRRRSQRRRRRDFFGRKKKILRERKKKEGGGWPPGNALGSPNNKRNQTERGERADQLPSLLVRWFRGRVGKGAAFLHTHTIPPPSFHDGRASGSKTRPLPPAQRYPSPLLGFFKNVVCSAQKIRFLLLSTSRKDLISIESAKKSEIGKPARGQRAIR